MPIRPLEAVSDVKDALGISDVQKELRVQSVNTIDDNTYYRFQQYYNDIPVYGRSVVINAENTRAKTLTSNFTNIDKDTAINKKFEEDKIKYSIVKYFNNPNVKLSPFSEDHFCIFNFDNAKKATLAYCCQVFDDENVYTCLLDASTAEVLLVNAEMKTVSAEVYSEDKKFSTTGWKNDDGSYYLYNEDYKISIFDVKGITTTNENGEVKENFRDYGIDTLYSKKGVFDKDAIILLNNIIKFNEYYKKLGDCAFDQIHGAINDEYDNGNNARGGSATVNGKNLAVILMGKNTSTTDIDVIAHEYTHAVTDLIVNFKSTQNNRMPSAIDEAFSDVFGELIESKINDTDAPNWMMDSDVINLRRNISGNSENQIYNLNNYNEKTSECHMASTIISHAAYLMWNGNGDSDIFKIDSDKLAKLWYRSLFLLQSDATFNQCANAVMLVAESMQYTGELTEAQVACVRRAFESVGIYPDNYLAQSSTNGAAVHVKDIHGNNLSSYYLKITDENSKVIVEDEFTDNAPYIVNVNANGIYTFIAKQSKSSEVEYVTKVRILNINRENSELFLQTGLDLGKNNDNSTGSKDTINLLEGFWENDIQCPCLYKFFEDGTVDEYYIDPLNRDNPEKISYSCTLKYQWDGKSLVINWGDNGLGEVYTTTLEPVTNSAPIEWDGDFSYLPNDEIFFYETSWVDSGGPSDNAMWLVKSKWRESDVSIPESNEKSAVSSQQLTISESESNKPNINTPNEPIKWLFDSKNGTLTITGTGKVTANWGGINKESVQKVVLDDRVTEIDSWIFTGCSNITDIKLPSRLKKIGNHAFKDCTNLKHVNYPEGLVEIETEAFWGCLSLEGIILPNSLKTLGDRVFADCSSAKRITIGKGLTSIPFSTFSGNTSVEFIEIPNGVRTLGSYAFARCTSLKKVIIGDGVTTIESWAFSECISLTEIHIGSNVKELSDFGVFENCKSLTSIVLPEGLTTVGQQSFKGCTSLKSITIPKSVTKIDAYYIDGCNALTDIYYKGTRSEWNAIQKSGDYGNTESVLKHVTIHYNY